MIHQEVELIVQEQNYYYQRRKRSEYRCSRHKELRTEVDTVTRTVCNLCIAHRQTYNYHHASKWFYSKFELLYKVQTKMKAHNTCTSMSNKQTNIQTNTYAPCATSHKPHATCTSVHTAQSYRLHTAQLTRMIIY